MCLLVTKCGGNKRRYKRSYKVSLGIAWGEFTAGGYVSKVHAKRRGLLALSLILVIAPEREY